MDYFSIPNALKKAALFQKYSYWVYKNDTTGAIDCTYVKSDLVSGCITNTSSDGSVDYITDYIRMPLQSTLFYQFNISGKLGDFGTTTGFPFFAGIEGLQTSCNYGNTAFVLHDDSITNHKGENYYDCSVLPHYRSTGGDYFIEFGEHSNFNVNNVYFDKVRETRSIFQSSDYYFHNNTVYFRLDTIDFYFSPGYGLVKFILRVDTAENNALPKRATISWSLLRYKIVM